MILQKKFSKVNFIYMKPTGDIDDDDNDDDDELVLWYG